MISSPPMMTLLLLLLTTAGAAVIAWVVPSVGLRRTKWTAPVRATVVSVFHGPVLAVILAAGLLELDSLFWSANPGAFPSLLSPAAVVVIAELAVIWTAVGVAALAVRRHVISVQERSGRYLLYGIYMAGLLGVVIALLSSPEVPPLAGGIWAVVGFGAGLLVTYLVVHTVNIVAERYFSALANRRPHLDTIYRFLRRALLGVIAFLGVAVSTYANFPTAAAGVTSLVLAAGFLSIVIGLAAQSTLSNVVAGAMVSLAQPFEIGDAVVFPYPNGDWCYVEDIRLTYTVLRTWDLRRLMVPNAMFQSSVVVNYTAVDPTMLVIVYMVITYDSDVDKAREIMVEEARKHPDFKSLGNLPVTHVMDYQGGGNQGSGMYGGVDLRLLSAAKDQPTAFQVEKDLLYSIRKRFDQEGIQIAYPTQRVIVEPSIARTSAPANRKQASDG
ncbi:MAG TPA: mechanosensitive ion channel family protein [Thermoplasmata archaeon]|nr:mechanosensitive ion channel family protein [Thermoplasmata archaeon]